MKLTYLTVALLILMVLGSNAYAVTMTFDDIPQGWGMGYYQSQYGIGIGGFDLVDHAGSNWGVPHSGSLVALYNQPEGHGGSAMFFYEGDHQPHGAYSVGGYFSTKPGVVMQMIGFYIGMDNEVASSTIGAPGVSWDNIYVQIDSPGRITGVRFVPVTTDAQWSFCMDDININFSPVPEPSSLAVLGFGLLPLAFTLRRRNKG